MDAAYHRHDISDAMWALLEDHLPDAKAHGAAAHKAATPATIGSSSTSVSAGRRLIGDRRFGSLRTGAPWRDLPLDYSSWKNMHRRFCRRRNKGVWENCLSCQSKSPILKD
ncbi:MAG: transposase [Planctomycetaceae bacterium]|nr:transposase [Planctomycetaceae bacterium]